MSGRDYDDEYEDMVLEDAIWEANEILDNIDKTKGTHSPEESSNGSVVNIHRNNVVPLKKN